MKKRAIEILLVLSLVSPLRAATTYYCDPNGNDANDGSSWEEAWQTMSRAMDANVMTPSVAGGDTVYFKGGNYGAYVETLTSSRTSYITYKAASGSVPVVPYIWAWSGSYYDIYLKFDGFKIQASASTPVSVAPYFESQPHCYFRGSYWDVNNCRFEGYSNKWTYESESAISCYGGHDGWVRNCVITRPAGAGMDGGFTIGIRGAGCDDVNIIDTTIEYCETGIYVPGSGTTYDWTLDNVVVRYLGSWGVIFSDVNQITINECDIHDIRYVPNYTDSNGASYVKSTNKITTKGNPTFPKMNYSYATVRVTDSNGSYCYSHHDGKDWEWLPIQSVVAGANSVTLYTSYYSLAKDYPDLIKVECRTGRHHTDGIHIWGHNDNFIVRNTKIYNSQGQELFTEGTGSGWIIENNLLHHNSFDGYGVASMAGFPLGVTGITLRNNTIDGRFSGGDSFATFKGNIIRQLLTVNPSYDDEDYNIWATANYSHGAHTIVTGDANFPLLFNNADTNDYTLASFSTPVDFMPPDDATVTDLLGNARVDITDVNHSSSVDNYADAGAYELQDFDPNNNFPVWDACPDKQVYENRTLTFDVNAKNIDDDPLTYSLLNPPSGAVFNPTMRTFTWTPTYRQSGEYTLIFSVNDGTVDEVLYPPVKVTVVNVKQYGVFKR